MAAARGASRPESILNRHTALWVLGLVALLAGGVGYMIRRHSASSPDGAKRARRFDTIRAMVPMRDGVKLETVIFVPKGKHAPLPFLLRRTPYGVTEDEENEPGSRGAGGEGLLADDYIWVEQNLRGRFKSEGTFVMLRPARDRSDPHSVDEGTDAYDTIEWLLHNVPGNNGRAGMLGASYDGWTQVMALLEPHPALRAINEQASPSDMFVNDDDHHNGAFRLAYSFEYVALMETAKDKNFDFEFDRLDTYDWFLTLGALSHVDERYFHGQRPSWTDYVEHPNRDAFWVRSAVGTHLERTTVPNLNTAGFWDQEDFVGPLDIYTRLEKNDGAHLNYLVVGPWNHGSWMSKTGRKLGPIDFGVDTAKDFRAMQRQWFAHWLHDGPLDLPEATVFESGSNRWKKFDYFPPEPGAASRRLYLRAGGKLSFEPPTESDSEGFDSYVSDPENPVPYRHRPIGPTFSDPAHPWSTWLLEDQRFVDRRPDVLSWQTDVLDRDVTVDGDIVADLYASTSGTDSDWVVKLIDVYPEDKSWAKDDDAGTPDLRGYQLMIADDVFRGRFRNSFEHPEPVPSDTVVHYAIDLHPNAHAFLRGHRIMVQVQSTWFPLIDRNPQKYVDNIFKARDSDFTRATQRVFRSHGAPSSIALPATE